MKVTFKDENLEELYSTPLSNIGKQQYSKVVIKHFQSKVKMLKYADDLGQIAKFKSMNLEKVNSKKHKLCYSVRVNDQFRILFKEVGKGEIEIYILELSKHYE